MGHLASHDCEFAEPMLGFTTNDISALARILAAQQADIDRLAERLDNMRIGKLRDRVKALEAQVSRLKASATAGEQSTSTFTAAERVLLTAIPTRTRQTCEPRRDQNPTGTVAAVQCKPATAKVRDMAYYLMDGPDADTAYQTRMDAYGAKPGFDRCARGKPGDIVFTGGFQASGCYLNEDGRANLHYVVSPWDNCMNLKAGRTRIKHPTLYIAVLGPDADIASLTDWAEPKGDARPRALFKPFRRRVDACGFTPPT